MFESTGNGNGTSRAVRQPRRRRWGSYRLPAAQRAVLAAAAVNEHGWSTKRAASAFCVCQLYVSLVKNLSDDDQLKLDRGELALSALYKNYRQRLAERRTERLAAQREAQVQAAQEAWLRAVDDIVTRTPLSRLVERVVHYFGPEPLLEQLEAILQRRGYALPERMVAMLDAVTAPPTNGNGSGAQV